MEGTMKKIEVKGKKSSSLYFSSETVCRCIGYNRWHKVHIYLEYHNVCPLVGIGTPPVPSLPSGCARQAPGGGGGVHLRVWGSSNSDDWRKSLALCLLYTVIVGNEHYGG
jgi:hypothetical protein